ncbi:major facilitator superfamily domain-containing protein [Chlamydoabsidia padenii]|nr:major facilitator superfamily domain-containing protein [Chlamydoabsidia padenii]
MAVGQTPSFTRALTFSTWCLYGSAIAYLAIFYDEELKMAPQEIGLLLATPYFVQIISSPLWTMVADRNTRSQGRLMALLALLGSSSVLLLLPLTKQVGVGSFPIFWSAMVLALMFSFFGSPLVALVDSSVLKILGDEKILYGNQRLWGSISNGICIFVVGMMISSTGVRSSFYLFGAGTVCLITCCLLTRFDNGGEQDTITEEQQTLINKSEVRGNYAYNPQPQHQQQESSNYMDDDRQSRRSSIITNNTGYVPPPFFGQTLPSDHSGIWRRDSVTSHANTLYLDDEESRRYHQLLQTITSSTTYAAMNTQLEANQVMSNLPQDEYPSIGLALSHIPTVEASLAAFSLVGQQTPDGLNLSIEKSSLKSLRVQTFLLMVLLFGLAYSMIGQFLFLIYRNDLGMNPSYMGLTGPLAGFAEVITFWLSKKLFDTYSVTTLTTAAHLLNLVFMTLKRDDITSIIIALGLQIINGFCYAMMWSTAVAEVDTFFPEEQRAMAQGILAALFSGLGYGLGCIISGVIYDQYGSQCLLGASSCIAMFGLGIFLIGRLDLGH